MGPCPAPCNEKGKDHETLKTCDVCNTWNDIIEDFSVSMEKRGIMTAISGKAQFGYSFPDEWVLVATHQCHDLYHCEPKYRDGEIDPDNMPGGPYKDPDKVKVPFGHKCKGNPREGWGNLGKCVSWKQCFQKCLDNSIKAGKHKPDDQCNLVHYEVDSGHCTSFTWKECCKTDSRGRLDGKCQTTEADNMIVMRSYHESQDFKTRQAEIIKSLKAAAAGDIATKAAAAAAAGD